MVFEKANSGMKYYRSVYTFEEAIGWLGGILTILYSILQTIFIPFTKDQLTYKVASKTKIGNLLQFDSMRFKCLKSMNNICSCFCCYSKRSKIQLISFSILEQSINEQLNIFPIEAIDEKKLMLAIKS